MLLTPKRSDKKEILDTEDYTEKDLEENLKDIRFWNRIFGVHALMLRYIKKIIGKYNLSKIKILDVGTGSGDIPRCIVKYLRNKNIPVKILAIDSNPITVKIAKEYTKDYQEIMIKKRKVQDLSIKEKFDIVLFNLTLHHIAQNQRINILNKLYSITSKSLIVSDLNRSLYAYWTVKLLTPLLTKNYLSRHDAPLSVLKSMTKSELQNLVSATKIKDFEIKKHMLFRNFLVAYH